MALSTSANTIKYLLFFFNFLFVITGIIILAIGATVQGVYRGYDHFLDDKFFSVPALLIAIGIIIFCISIFGCIGAAKENYCMILTFSSLLIIVFILELAAGISGYVLRNDTRDLITRSLSDSMANYGNDSHRDITSLWDEIQREFQCCGLENATDWLDAIDAVPMSCCRRVDGITGIEYCNENSTTIWRRGCVSAFGNYIRSHAVSLGAAGVALCIIQFIGIFFACFLARQIKNNQGLSVYP